MIVLKIDIQLKTIEDKVSSTSISQYKDQKNSEDIHVHSDIKIIKKMSKLMDLDDMIFYRLI